jgi:hypothetical protein
MWAFRNAGGSLFIATSTQTATSSVSAFSIYSGGSVVLPEYKPVTSTSQSIDWLSGNQQLVNFGTAAITVTFKNVTAGATLTLTTCMGPSTGGAITFSGAHFSGGVQPGNTTTANQCDMWFFRGTLGTTTTAYPVLTGIVSGIQ